MLLDAHTVLKILAKSPAAKNVYIKRGLEYEE